MNDKEFNEKKKELMKPDYTENLHHVLEELQIEDARKIVESMTDMEIGQKVNIRQHQEDYIADYLEYLWEISESAYWRHLKSTIDTKFGLLWGGDVPHFVKLCNKEIPNDVWEAVLDFALNVEIKGNYTQDFEAIGCVIKAQVEKFGRLKEIKKRISFLDKDNQDAANNRIKEMLNSKCNYQFFYDE